MKLSEEDNQAALVVYRALSLTPNLSDGTAKDLAKGELGISRMGKNRWEAIKSEAQRLFDHPGHQSTHPYAYKDPHENKRDEPQKPSRPHSGPSMGMLLSAELKEVSTGEHQAAVLLCHCPHCGGAVRVNASVTKGGES